MVTIIDALVMTLGLDTKDYDRNRKRSSENLDKFKKQSDSVAKDVAAGGKRMAEGFAAVKVELLGMLTLLGASTGLKDFIDTQVTGQAALGRMSRNLDMSAKRIEAWQTVAKEMGGTAADANNALQAVAGGLAEASINGHSALTDAAARNGISLAGVKDSGEALLRISERLHQLPRQQAMYVANQLGVGSMFNQLDGDTAVLKKHLAYLASIYQATKKSTNAAELLQKRWADTQAKISGAFERAFIKIEPGLERLLNRFNKWLDSVNWDHVIDQIEHFAHVVNEVAQAFGGWKNVAIALGSVLALKILSPITGIIGGLIRLIPYVATAAAGMATMTTGAIALASALGALAGLGIWKAIEGTKAGDFVSKTTALAMAAMGSTTAKNALLDQQWAGYSQARRQQLTSEYSSNPAFKQIVDAKNPELARLINQSLTAAGQNYGNADPRHSKIFNGDNAALFASLEKKAALPPGTLAAVFKQESGGGRHLLSPAGAKGPFQFTDATAKEYGLHGSDVYDLDKSATAASLLLHDLRGRFGGSMVKALAAYNAGSGNVRKYGGIPPFAETQNYVRSVMSGISAKNNAMARSPGGLRSSTSTAETHIGKIEVNTQATDAAGIARDIGYQLQNQGIVALADPGMH